MMEYGTGAVMSVPAHDERDFEFAKKFDLPIRTVIVPRDSDHETSQNRSSGWTVGRVYRLRLAGQFRRMDGQDTRTLRRRWRIMPRSTVLAKRRRHTGCVTGAFPASGFGVRRYRSSIATSAGQCRRSTRICRCGCPKRAPFTGTGESPLAKVPEFYETTCPNCDGPRAARRTRWTRSSIRRGTTFDTRTRRTRMPFDPEIAQYWTPVDQYIGGDDHAVMHLIYARFWTKVMRDHGDGEVRRAVQASVDAGNGRRRDVLRRFERQASLLSAGGCTVNVTLRARSLRRNSPDGKDLKYAIERMSKSKGNGVDPDEMVEIYGADARKIVHPVRRPDRERTGLERSGDRGRVSGSCSAFGGRTNAVVTLCERWRCRSTRRARKLPPAKLRRKTHQTIKRVDDAFESLQFNTPVAALMELSNAIGDVEIEPADATPRRHSRSARR